MFLVFAGENFTYFTSVVDFFDFLVAVIVFFCPTLIMDFLGAFMLLGADILAAIGAIVNTIAAVSEIDKAFVNNFLLFI